MDTDNNANLFQTIEAIKKETRELKTDVANLSDPATREKAVDMVNKLDDLASLAGDIKQVVEMGLSPHDVVIRQQWKMQSRRLDELESKMNKLLKQVHG